MALRLGLDLGTNSLGWCLVELDHHGMPIQLKRLGVRLFPDGRDPQSEASLAVDRRIARGARKRRDRYVGRRTTLVQHLVRCGLFPADRLERKALESLDPYALRADALERPLLPHELGRVLFHLNQRRGFKSNRKTDAGDQDSGKIKAAVGALDERLADAGAPTLGVYLAARRPLRHSVRARLQGTGAKAAYDFYPARKHIEAEFEAIRAAQAPHHPDLDDAAWDLARRIIFHQRPLRPVTPGRCLFHPEEERAPWALPLAQRFRILSELANLRLGRVGRAKEPLTDGQRAALLDRLLRFGERSFARIRSDLHLDPDTEFNLADAKRDRLKGDKTAESLGKAKHFGKAWRTLPPERQTEIVERLLAEEDEAALITWLQETAGLSEMAARSSAAAGLPSGHCRLGRRALADLVPIMEEQGVDYAEAARRAGYHHSDFRSGELRPSLPYYGEILERHIAFGTGNAEDPDEKRLGRIANPTVHIGLNQLRTVVNGLIAEHGRPDQIVLEIGRDLKQSLEARREQQREQARNQKKNEERKALVKSVLGEHHEPTAADVMRVRLWEELGSEPGARQCVYTGRVIGAEHLFSAEIDVDHILPFSRTLDDSAANRIVCHRHANRAKRKLSPCEAFSGNPDGFHWDDICRRAEALPKNKRWRFAPDAMARFDTEADFLGRQLNETRYLSRLAKAYLGAVCDPDSIWVVPGKLTSLLRGKWGLNSLLSDANFKNRLDHRHHAIDAAVVAVTDRSTIQKVQRAAGRAEDETLDRKLIDLEQPWPGFRDALADRVRRVVVSVKPDHGQQGQLHNATAYGPVTPPDATGMAEVAYRKPLVDLRETEFDAIRDAPLRDRVRAAVVAGGAAGETPRAALERFSRETGIRRVRLLERIGQPIPIGNRRTGAVYKLFKGDSNFAYDLFATPNGRWTGTIISLFAANQADGRSPTPPGCKPVMRLFKDDMVALDVAPHRRIMRVVKFSQGRIVLADQHEAGALKARNEDKTDPFRYLTVSPDRLRQVRGRRITVSPTGRVRDPGPPA